MRGVRRKAASQQLDDSGSSTGKRTPVPAGPPEQWRLEAAIVSLLTLTDADNRLICPPFRVLPTSEEFPLYYQHIKNPIDLKRIAERIRDGHYASWTALETDIQLLCANAKQFNEPGSMVYKDSAKLLSHFQLRAAELAESRRSSARVLARNKEYIDELLRSTASEVDQFSEDSEEDEDSERSDDLKWRLYWTIRNFDVVDGVPLCENFMELPSKRSYPDYYEEIERPMSLYMVNKKLKRDQYPDLASLVQDLLLIFDNACSYNIEESEIYESAMKLRRLTLQTAKKLEPAFKVPRGNAIFIKQEIEEEPKEKPVIVAQPSPKMNGTMTIASPAAKRPKLAATATPTRQVLKREASTKARKQIAEDEEMMEEEDEKEKKRESIVSKRKSEGAESVQTAPKSAEKKKTTTTTTDESAAVAGTASTSGVAEKSVINAHGKASGEPTRKRHRARLNADGTPAERLKPGRKSVDELRDKFVRKLMAVWEDVRNLKLGDRALSEPFLYLPCDKKFPDYYKTIKQPISLDCIRKKIQDHKYADSDEVLRDLQLMFANAKKYNQPGSKIVTDCAILESVATGSMSSHTEGTTLFYPYRRTEKGWTEQASIEKSPLKSKRRGGEKSSAKSSSSTPTTMTTSTAATTTTTTMTAATTTSSAPATALQPEVYNISMGGGETGETVYYAGPPLPYPAAAAVEHQQCSSSQGSAIVALSNDAAAAATSTEEVAAASVAGHQYKSKALLLAQRLRERRAAAGVANAEMSRVERQMHDMLEALLTLRDERESTTATTAAAAGEERVLADLFMELPSKEDFPAYYRLIKSPMDLNRVGAKLISRNYGDNWRPFVADLRLCLENACNFNEPDSGIYADAVALLRLLTQLKDQIFEEQPLESVQARVRQLLNQLFTFVHEYKDERGHRLCDSLESAYALLAQAEAEKRPGSNGSSASSSSAKSSSDALPFSLDVIRRNLERGRYKRLDRFQEDMFALLARVRDAVELDSKPFIDLVELQHQFITKREALCKGVIVSSASLYTHSSLNDDLERRRKERERKQYGGEKKTTMTPKKEEKKVEETASEVLGEKERDDTSLEGNEEEEKEGRMDNNIKEGKKKRDFFSEDEEEEVEDHDQTTKKPMIVQMEEQQEEDEEEEFVVVDDHDYQPLLVNNHVATRKAAVDVQQDEADNPPAEKPKQNNEGEQQTMENQKDDEEQTKEADNQEVDKIAKVVGDAPENTVSAEPPEFDDVDKTVDEHLDIHREEVLLLNIPKDTIQHMVGYEPSNEYYQQMAHRGRFYRPGDGVLVYREGKPHCDVMRIDRLWKTQSGEKMFSGCRFARPGELKHEPSKMFFKQEVVAVKAVDSVERMADVQGPCAILTVKQYETCRPTEIPECDVFVVDQKVLGPPLLDQAGNRVPVTWKNCSVIAARCTTTAEQQQQDEQFGDKAEMDLGNAKSMRKLRQYNLSRDVAEDEIYYFKHPLIMEKVLSPLVLNPGSSDHALPISHSELDGEAQQFRRQLQQHHQQQRRQQASSASVAAASAIIDEEDDDFGEDEEEDELDMDMEVDGEVEVGADEDDLDDHFLTNNNHAATSSSSAATHATASPMISGRQQQSYQNGGKRPAQQFINPPTTTQKRFRHQQLAARFVASLEEQQEMLEEKKDVSLLLNNNINNAATSSSTPTVSAGMMAQRNNGTAKASTSNSGWLATQPKLNAKSKSGYILFSAEVRKRVMQENPSAGFGEISKIVGIEWKRLSDEQKRQYESRASFIAEERAKAELLTPRKQTQPGQIRVHCCRWQQCDYQFDTQEGLFEHIKTSHTSPNADSLDHEPTVEEPLYYACLWNSCLKYRKEGKPFPSLPRLLRHVREKHLLSAIRAIYPNQRTKHFFVYVPPPQNASVNGSKNAHHHHTGADDGGRFVHHPYGEAPQNPVPCKVATPLYSLTSIPSGSPPTTSGHHGTTPLTAALSQPPVASGSASARFLSSTPKSAYGTSHQQPLLNGALAGPTPTGASRHHYVVQGSSGYHQGQQSSADQLPPPPPPQPPQPSRTIVVNGVSVVIPANAQTVILPPGYLGPQQTQQIILHTAPPPPPPQPVVQQQVVQSQPPLRPPSNGPHQHQIIVQQQQQHHATPQQQQHYASSAASITQQQQQRHVAAASASTSCVSIQQQQQHQVQAVQQQQQQQQQHAPQPSTSAAVPQLQHQQQLIDAGRTVVSAPPKPAEPVFVEPSTSLRVQRVLHSEAYVKYIESMYNGNGGGKPQRTVSKWDKNLLATHRNTSIPSSSTSALFSGANRKQLAQEWLRVASNGSRPREEELVRALWNLRDQLVEGTVGIARHGPLPPGEPPAASSSTAAGPSGSGSATEKRNGGNGN